MQRNFTVLNWNILNHSKPDSFLVADKRLYKRLCPSVRPLVGRSVGRSVVIELGSAFRPLPTRPRLVLAVYPALLGATKHLYNWLCPLVGRSVFLSITHSF